MKQSRLRAAVEPYFALLREWNSSIRLTGSTETADLERHLAEAETLLPYLPAAGRLIDIGSGGGFPAVIVALARPEQELLLVEPIAKKVAFLQACRRSLKLTNVSVRRGRDTDLAADELGFDIATSQATFAPGEWFHRARRLVRPGGLIVALLGPTANDLPVDAEVHSVDVGDRSRRIASLTT